MNISTSSIVLGILWLLKESTSVVTEGHPSVSMPNTQRLGQFVKPFTSTFQHKHRHEYLYFIKHPYLPPHQNFFLFLLPAKVVFHYERPNPYPRSSALRPFRSLHRSLTLFFSMRSFTLLFSAWSIPVSFFYCHGHLLSPSTHILPRSTVVQSLTQGHLSYASSSAILPKQFVSCSSSSLLNLPLL